MEARLKARGLPPSPGRIGASRAGGPSGKSGSRPIGPHPDADRFNLFQAAGYYGFASWVPTLLIASGIEVTKSLGYTFIIAIAKPVGPVLGFWFADRIERKWQIVWAGMGIGGFMMLFATQTNHAWIIVFGVMVTLSNNWISFIFHGYQAELFPPASGRARSASSIPGAGRVRRSWDF